MRQDPEQAILLPGTNDLRDRLEVRGDVEMAEEHSLGLPGRAAGEDHRNDVIYRDLPAAGADFFDQRGGSEERQQQGLELAAQAILAGSSTPAFSRKVLLVTTVFRFAWRADDSSPSFPTV